MQVNQYQVEHVLEVTSPLAVRLFPMTQVTDSGATAVFNCTVDGFPVLNVYWLKNGQIVVPSVTSVFGLHALLLMITMGGERLPQFYTQVKRKFI